MKLIDVAPDSLIISDDLRRSGNARQFDDRLKSSIEQIGLVEPIKVAPLPTGKYLVIDGTLRLKAIAALRDLDPAAFSTIPAYLVDYDRRYELRFQTDIYQDLLPSQLAELVEHLHQTKHILKSDIARYIGVSPTTVRNYTGLWRLLQRGGLFARVVELMDVDVIPSSNPYAWLRLTEAGLRQVLEDEFSSGENAEDWIGQRVAEALRGKTIRFTLKFVEAVTSALPSASYREGEDLRTLKRGLGLRRATSTHALKPKAVQPELDLAEPSRLPQPVTSTLVQDAKEPHEAGSGGGKEAIRYLLHISRHSPDPVLQVAARSLRGYLE
jgi:hypothetical protein